MCSHFCYVQVAGRAGPCRIIAERLSARLLIYWNSGLCVLPDLQHWLFTEHLSDLNSVNNKFTSVGVSGMDSGILLCGHPYGGCGILYRKSLSPYVKTLHTGLNCSCSIKLCDSVGTSFLLICVYLPTDFQ